MSHLYSCLALIHVLNLSLHMFTLQMEFASLNKYLHPMALVIVGFVLINCRWSMVFGS